MSKFLPGEHRNVTLYSKYLAESPENTILTYQLGQMNNYTLTAEKNNNFFFKRIDEKIVSLENESVAITLDPSSGREEIDYTVAFSVAVIIILYSGIIYKKYKKTRKQKNHESESDNS